MTWRLFNECYRVQLTEAKWSLKHQTNKWYCQLNWEYVNLHWAANPNRMFEFVHSIQFTNFNTTNIVWNSLSILNFRYSTIHGEIWCIWKMMSQTKIVITIGIVMLIVEMKLYWMKSGFFFIHIYPFMCSMLNAPFTLYLFVSRKFE